MPFWLDKFGLVFLSIYLEALPFLLLGCFVSAVIHVFASENSLLRFLPRNKWLGIISASFLGLIFPVCDCGIYPVARKLIEKKVPIHIVITWMLAAPIVNPIVIFSTYYAFRNQFDYVVLRIGLGLLIACLIGFIFSLSKNKHILKNIRQAGNAADCSTAEDESHHECERLCHSSHSSKRNEPSLFLCWIEVINQTSHEFYEMGKFFLFGAVCSAAIQAFIPRVFLLSLGQHAVISVLVMIVLTFFLSICSEADAFIARTFLGQFSQGSIIAFLLFGPMMDLKNLLYLGKSFKMKFVFFLFSLIFLFCAGAGILLNYR